ncbi:MAG: methyltransferase [Anaerolineae bacterium]|nr:methyltransferase [Anaerolineae bacterium]
MNYRERFAATIQHHPVDRVPFDLAGTSLTGIEHTETTEKLQQLLELDGQTPAWYTKFDDRILQIFDIDFRRVGDILSPASSLARPVRDGRYTDCWGITYQYTGLYWDIVNPPLKNATCEDLDAYPWPQAADIDRRQIALYREQAKHLYHETDYVVVGEHPVFGVFELGCWMCGFDAFLLRMAQDPGFVHAFFRKVLAYQVEVIELYYGAIGPYLHLTTSGDDFGMQNRPFVSPAMFREMIKSYYTERIRRTRQFTDAVYFHHTCGAVFPLIPDLVDAGVQILNPIQPGAREMEPETLKANFGSQLTFWGGIDTQHLLPEGSPADVHAGVQHVLDVMAHNGGYVLAPAHNLQPDVPAENIAALYAAGRDYFAG